MTRCEECRGLFDLADGGPRFCSSHCEDKARDKATVTNRSAVTSAQLHESAERSGAAFMRRIRPDLFPNGDEDDLAVHDPHCSRCRAIRVSDDDTREPPRARCNRCVGREVAVRIKRVYPPMSREARLRAKREERS
jgi:hypothetical protein